MIFTSAGDVVPSASTSASSSSSSSRCKMAARSVVCNDLLRFSLSKYGKVSNKVLTDTVVEAFEATAIYEVKIRLLEDISALGSCDELPYISKDKSTSGQPTNDIDDMYALLILATDHDLTNKLP